MCILCALYKVCSCPQMRTQSSIYRLWGQTQLVLALGARKLSTNQKIATSFHPSSFLIQLAPKQSIELFKPINWRKEEIKLNFFLVPVETIQKNCLILAQPNQCLPCSNWRKEDNSFLVPIGARRTNPSLFQLAQGRIGWLRVGARRELNSNFFLVPFLAQGGIIFKFLPCSISSLFQNRTG